MTPPATRSRQVHMGLSMNFNKVADTTSAIDSSKASRLSAVKKALVDRPATPPATAGLPSPSPLLPSTPDDANPLLGGGPIRQWVGGLWGRRRLLYGSHSVDEAALRELFDAVEWIGISSYHPVPEGEHHQELPLETR